jgi:hypothetical protein
MPKFSTGLRNAMLDTGSLKATMDGCFLKIYAGTAPADADAALGSPTLLCTLSDNGGVGGLTFASAAADGAISKDVAQIWKGTNVATGTAAFFRVVGAADDGSSSTTAPRMQGTIGNVSTDMLLADTTLTDTEEFILEYFYVSLPTD